MSLQKSLVFLPGVLLPKVAALGLVVFGTRLLSKQEYGYFSLVVLLGEMVDSIAGNWLRIGLLRAISGTGQLARAFVGQAARRAAMAIICGAVALSIYFLLRQEAESVRLLIACSAYVVATGCLKFSLTILQGEQDAVRYSLVEGWRAVLMLVTVLSVMRWTGSFFAGSLVAAAIMLAFGGVSISLTWRRLRNEARLPPPPVYLPSIILVTALGFLVAGVERLMLEAMVGAAAVAVYSASYSLARQGFDVVGNAANMTGFTRLLTAYQSGTKQEVRSVVGTQLSVLLILFIPALVALCLFSQDITRLFLPQTYHENAAFVMCMVGVGAVAVNLKTFLFDNILHAVGRSKLQLVPLTVGALVCVVVGTWAIPQYAERGAACAFALGALASCCVCAAVATVYVRPYCDPVVFLRFGKVFLLLCVTSFAVDRFLLGGGPLWRISVEAVIVGGEMMIFALPLRKALR